MTDWEPRTPPRLHLYWQGDAPGWVAERVAEWRRLMPDWDIHLWGDEPELAPIAGLAFETARNVAEIDHVRHGASLVRWWLLHEYGGVWADCDVSPLLPLNPLLDGRPFVSMFPGGLPIPCVVGGPAKHPMWLAMIDGARSNRGTSPNVTGNRHLLRVARGYDIHRLPASSFLDRDARGAGVPLDVGITRYATHAWATSSTR